MLLPLNVGEGGRTNRPRGPTFSSQCQCGTTGMSSHYTVHIDKKIQTREKSESPGLLAPMTMAFNVPTSTPDEQLSEFTTIVTKMKRILIMVVVLMHVNPIQLESYAQHPFVPTLLEPQPATCGRQSQHRPQPQTHQNTTPPSHCLAWLINSFTISVTDTYVKHTNATTLCYMSWAIV